LHENGKDHGSGKTMALERKLNDIKILLHLGNPMKSSILNIIVESCQLKKLTSRNRGMGCQLCSNRFSQIKKAELKQCATEIRWLMM
jgi:hypothetical protein